MRQGLIREFTIAILLAVAGQAQALGQGLYDCGARRGVNYAAVFDASSSLRENEESRAKTVNEYVNVLRLLSGSLCRSDSLFVHSFAADAARRMSPVHVLTPANRSAAMLRQVANTVIDSHTDHTDLHLALQGIRTDILPNRGILSVFLITDGSFYPRTPTLVDRTMEGLRDRLDALSTLADTLRAFETRRVGQAAGIAPLYVVGVRSGDAAAIDSQLKVVFPELQSERLWTHRGDSVDLRDDKGADLLAAVFGDRFSRLDKLSLWPLFVSSTGGLWTDRFGYSSGWGFTLPRLQHLTVRHLIFLPGVESAGCPSLPVPVGREELAAVAISTQGHVMCSVEHPSREQIAALGHFGVKDYALLQGGTHMPAGSLSALQGLHDFVLADSGKTCELATVAAQFDQGERWPPRDAQAVAQVWTIPLGAAEEGMLRSEAMDLIRLPLSNCLVPRFSGSDWERDPGEYAVFVRESGGTTVYGSRFETPPARVVEQFVRPAGFPLPADELALVRVCVQRVGEIATDERMWLWLQGKLFPLTAERARKRCPPGRADPGSHLYGFSGLALLDGGDIGTARIFISRGVDGLPPTSADRWIPVELTVDGKLFLSWTGLIWVFVAGFFVQFFYLLLGTDFGRQEGVFILFRLSTLASGTLSGILLAVGAEFFKMVREADIGADKVPVIFALSILAHMTKILAAALIPEHVEECLFD